MDNFVLSFYILMYHLGCLVPLNMSFFVDQKKNMSFFFQSRLHNLPNAIITIIMMMMMILRWRSFRPLTSHVRAALLLLHQHSVTGKNDPATLIFFF